MKASRYNIILRDSGFSYWYNSLSNRFFRLSESVCDKLERNIASSDDIESFPQSFYEKLVDFGFIIDDKIDELEKVREKNESAIRSKDYFLVILPTLDCNFKCWYCIQDHIVSKMSFNTLEKLKNHIKYMLSDCKITSLSIEWFGGEPFMYFDDIISPLSEFAIKNCKEYGVPFRNSATTNAFYLNDTVIEKLDFLEFKNFQITLDGSKEFHDKVKFQHGIASSFDYVLKNIDRMLKVSPQISVTLRINYTHNNLNEKIVEEVKNLISELNRNRITIAPRKVWQEKPDKSFMSKVRNILDLFNKAGFNVERSNHVTSFIPCYANKEFYNAINFNGHVVKCTACNDLYDPDPKGILMSDGRIVWKDNFDRKYQNKSFENDRCLSCKKLPACMSQCPRNYIEGRRGCKYDFTDNSFEDDLFDLMKNSYS